MEWIFTHVELACCLIVSYAFHMLTLEDFLLLQLQKINDEQKSKIRKTERALKVAEVSF